MELLENVNHIVLINTMMISRINFDNHDSMPQSIESWWNDWIIQLNAHMVSL